MPIQVQLADGRIVEYGDEYSREQIQADLDKFYPVVKTTAPIQAAKSVETEDYKGWETAEPETLPIPEKAEARKLTWPERFQLFKQSLAERPPDLEPLTKAALEPFRSTARGVAAPISADETIQSKLEKDYTDFISQKPLDPIDKALETIGGFAGPLAQWMATARVGGPHAAAASFGFGGAYNAAREAYIKAREAGKTGEESLAIAKAAAPVGGAIAGAQTYVLPTAMPTTLAGAAKSTIGPGLAFGYGKLLQNVYERALGLPTPISEGVAPAAAMGAAMPIVGAGLHYVGGKLLAKPTTPKPAETKIPSLEEVKQALGNEVSNLREFGAPQYGVEPRWRFEVKGSTMDVPKGTPIEAIRTKVAEKLKEYAEPEIPPAEKPAEAAPTQSPEVKAAFDEANRVLNLSTEEFGKIKGQTAISEQIGSAMKSKDDIAELIRMRINAQDKFNVVSQELKQQRDQAKAKGDIDEWSRLADVTSREATRPAIIQEAIEWGRGQENKIETFKQKDPNYKPAVPMTDAEFAQLEAKVKSEIAQPPAPKTEPAAIEPGKTIAPEEQPIAPEVPKAAEPPSVSPPAVTGEPITPESFRRNRDYQFQHRIMSPQHVFWFGKLGEAAKKAWETMALGEFSMRANIARSIENVVKRPLKALPRALRKQGGKAFFEALDGKTMEQIEAEWRGKPNGEQVIEQARRVKGELENIRVTIRDTKRTADEGYYNGLSKDELIDLYKNNVSESNIPDTKAELSKQLARSNYPDDWGIADGSYLPHLFMGRYKIKVGNTVIAAKTRAEALSRMRQMMKDNPALKPEDFSAMPEMSIPGDMVRLFDKRFFALLNEMKKRLQIDVSEIRDAQRGIIGRKAAKQKWFGSLIERFGFKGYEKNFERSMTAYLSGFHRWKTLNEVQRNVMPLIEQVRAEGRPNAANRLEGIMENLWGKRTQASSEFDAMLERVPVLRDYVEPMALDRWSRFARSATAALHLSTLRFGLINRLQPLQGLYPIFGEGLVSKGKVLQHTAEGRKLLDEFGITFDPGQYGEAGSLGTLQRWRQRLSGERSNQELSFLTAYLHGRETGLSHAEAGNYGRLRGQLMTQFTPLITDIPQAFEGPIAQTIFQYKRFPVKQLELMARMGRDKNLPGIARWLLASTITGGLAYFLKQAWAPAKIQYQVRTTLEDELGKDGAELVYHGLPGMLNADLSGSLVLGDQPQKDLWTTLGRAVGGPVVSTPVDIARTLATEPREALTAPEKAAIAAKRIPALRPFGEFYDLMNKNLDVLGPDGEVVYHRTLQDILAGMGSFRGAKESNVRNAMDAIKELDQESRSIKNQYYVSLSQDEKAGDAAQKRLEDFNKRWPEAQITASEIKKYIRYRQRGAKKTEAERVQGRKYRGMIPGQ